MFARQRNKMRSLSRCKAENYKAEIKFLRRKKQKNLYELFKVISSPPSSKHTPKPIKRNIFYQNLCEPEGSTKIISSMELLKIKSLSR